MNGLHGKYARKPMLLFASLMLTFLVGCGGGLSSGGSVTGYLNPGDLHTIEFEANAGSSIYISVASDMQTYFTVINPDETELIGTFNSYLAHDIQQTGTYKILLQTRYAGGEGDYELHYANSVDANENGLLTSGGLHSSDLTSNDIDSFTFDAVAGDSVHLYIDSSNQTAIYLFDPNGALLQSGFNTLFAQDLELDGVYRIFVAGRYAFTTDNYDLHFVNGTTSTEMGFLTSGGMHSATLTSNDLDTFQFAALTGDSIHLSIASSNQTYMTVYEPDGSILTANFNALYIENVPQDGDYRVVVQGRYAFTTDDYDLHYMNSRTAVELGFLTSGTMVSESLTSNDLDTFQFSAMAGDTIHVSIGSSNQTFMRLFNPDGSFLTSGYNGMLVEDLPQNGDYRLVVQSRFAFFTDDYELHFVNTSLAVEHGSLPAQGSIAEMISVSDLDSYSIDLAVSEDLALSASGDIPVRVYLYRPDGSLIGSGNNGYSLLDVEVGGTYIVVVASYFAFQSGAYTLSSTITP